MCFLAIYFESINKYLYRLKRDFLFRLKQWGTVWLISMTFLQILRIVALPGGSIVGQTVWTVSHITDSSLQSILENCTSFAFNSYFSTVQRPILRTQRFIIIYSSEPIPNCRRVFEEDAKSWQPVVIQNQDQVAPKLIFQIDILIIIKVTIMVLLVDQDKNFTQSSLSNIKSWKQSFKRANNHQKILQPGWNGLIWKGGKKRAGLDKRAGLRFFSG